MVIFAHLFIALGLFGIFESTLGSSGIAWLISGLISPIRKKIKNSALPLQSSLSIDILIAAHNEEHHICRTLSSLNIARNTFLSSNGVRSSFSFRPTVQIRVGLDHCTDATEENVLLSVSEGKMDLSIFRNEESKGKWNTLKQLVLESSADWVALVDSGSTWQPALLNSALPQLLNPEVMGIAPSYGTAHPSFFSRLFWGFERLLKQLESNAGGPTSVHGATVLYRRHYLVKIFDTLGKQPMSNAWLNDDVVIPLTLRTRWPELKISYLTRPQGKVWVTDHGMNETKQFKSSSEYGRRRRMVIGNLQWIQSLYVQAFRTDLCVGLIASRRVFRTFWAYWIVIFLSGLVLNSLAHVHTFDAKILNLSSLLALILFLTLIPLRGGLDRLRSTFLAGLEIPRYWYKAKHLENIWN